MNRFPKRRTISALRSHISALNNFAFRIIYISALRSENNSEFRIPHSAFRTPNAERRTPNSKLLNSKLLNSFFFLLQTSLYLC